MESWKQASCPVRIGSKNSPFRPWQRTTAPAAVMAGELCFDSSAEAGSSVGRLEDPLKSWPEKKRRRSRPNKCKALVVVPARQPAPPLPPAERRDMALVVFRALEFSELPIKKRVVIADRAAQENLHCCRICGQIFDSPGALSSHNAQHRQRPLPPENSIYNGALAVHTPPPAMERAGGQFIGYENSEYCKGQPPAESMGGSRGNYEIDLNKLPSPEVEERLALPWRG